jgi:TetR/AcrR family transcriptional regulator
MVERSRGRPSLQDKNLKSDEELLGAVLESFGENGFDGTSVREIARRVDVSHNLIPQRFGTKKRLWYAAVDYGFGRITQELVREAENLGDDDLLILRGLIAHSIELNATHPSLLQIVNQEASQPGPRLDYLFNTFIKPARDFGEKWLDHLAAEGRIRPTSVTLLYFLMTHGAGGFFAMPELAGRLAAEPDSFSQLTPRQQAEMAVDILFDGLLPR